VSFGKYFYQSQRVDKVRHSLIMQYLTTWETHVGSTYVYLITDISNGYIHRLVKYII